jgi:hypothetical protein
VSYFFVKEKKKKKQNTKQTLEKTEGAIENIQHRETGNIVQKRRTKTNKIKQHRDAGNIVQKRRTKK